MRIVEFLILLLETQADTLRRLAAFFGEEDLFEILENSAEDPSPEELLASRKASQSRIMALSFENPLHPMANSAYRELEGAVREFKLPEVLEFHLWAYPHYRTYIESTLDLNALIPSARSEAGITMVEEAVAQARAWVKTLHLPPNLALQAERAALFPWLRFRSSALTRIGGRPLGSV